MPDRSLPRLKAIGLTALLSLASLAPAQAQQRIDIQFPSGATSTTIDGSLRGGEYVDYVLNARGGQTMVVNLTVTDTNGNGSVFYNIVPAGQDYPAIYNGSTAPDRRAEVTLPSNGDWTIRVYQMGNDADTGRTSGYEISVRIAPSGESPGGSGSATRPGMVPEEDVFVVRTNAGGSLNVRNAPRASGTSLGTLPNGTTLANVGGCTISDGEQWCEVQPSGGGVRGWVAARFLALPGPGGGGSSNTSAASSGAGAVVQVTGVPAKDILNVRTGPGTGNRIVGALGNGSQVRRLECQSVGAARWCEIEMMTDMRERGWVNARYLTDPGGVVAPRPAATRTARVAFTAGTTGTEFTDQLAPGGSGTYLLGARDGQEFYFRLASTSGDLAWRIFNTDGSLLDEAGPSREYRGQLFQSGDHRIEVSNRGAALQTYNVIFGVQ